MWDIVFFIFCIVCLIAIGTLAATYVPPTPVATSPISGDPANNTQTNSAFGGPDVVIAQPSGLTVGISYGSAYKMRTTDGFEVAGATPLTVDASGDPLQIVGGSNGLKFGDTVSIETVGTGFWYIFGTSLMYAGTPQVSSTQFRVVGGEGNIYLGSKMAFRDVITNKYISVDDTNRLQISQTHTVFVLAPN